MIRSSTSAMQIEFRDNRIMAGHSTTEIDPGNDLRSSEVNG